MFTKELGDTMHEAISVFGEYWHVLLLVVVPFALIIYIIHKTNWRSLIGTLVLLGTICIFCYKPLGEVERFFPNGVRFTIYNSIKSFWGYIVIYRSKLPEGTYQPYEVRELATDPEEPVTIVYIIGESANFRHMSLFGYHRDTTPKLKELAKSSEFYYTPGLSGAISTWSSCKYITSVIQEPDNLQQTSSNETNLFRLAKTHGFKTFYLSNQTEHLLTCIGGTRYIDVLVTKDSNLIKAKELNDKYLFYLLGKQTFGRKNFIVLHQWSAHTPYASHLNDKETQYKKYGGSKDRRVDEYDNAMLYVDNIVAGLIERIKAQVFNSMKSESAQEPRKPGKLYIIWTSDHNELFGEGGRYGHGSGNLYYQTAEVPIIINSNDIGYLDKMKKIYNPTHYEISQSIANLLGYEIINPNAEKDVFYINGVDYNGKCGYIKCKKDTVNRTTSYETKH
jgi:glucan phosphoethanolaminetransferase (alkaline phosphatase superfamily)